MIISYAGYFPPKCTCNGRTTHLSKTCKFLLKCLYVMDEKVTHPFPCLEPSLTSSHMPKPNVSKTSFSKQKLFFSKTYYRDSVNILDYPLRRIVGSFFRNSHGSASEMNCWITLQGNSSENLPLKFLSQSFSIFFHVMHSHLLL